MSTEIFETKSKHFQNKIVFLIVAWEGQNCESESEKPGSDPEFDSESNAAIPSF